MLLGPVFGLLIPGLGEEEAAIEGVEAVESTALT